MNTITTVLLGNRRGNDHICAFSREILFRTAGEWVEDALPPTANTFYVHEEGTPSLSHASDIFCPSAERYQTLAATDAVFQSSHILLAAAPIPELTTQDYERLLRLHQSAGNDITLLCCDGDVQERFALLRDLHDAVSAIGRGEGERALHVAVFTSALLQKMLTTSHKKLFDIINAAIEQGAKIGTVHTRTVTEIVSGMDAYMVQKRMIERINLGHISRGVQIFAPDATYIAPDAVIGAGTTILPGTIVRGGCTIGSHAVIGPNTILDHAVIGDATTVNSSQVYESTVGRNATVGPFAYVRPGCRIGDDTRIGDFVELKKADIGNGTKVSHLTYIGDAEVGERVNFGCGTVVVNYDGYHKYKTEIGDDCFIGCNTNLVSPVKLGKRVFTAAGATITSDVPDGALAVARVRQKNMEGWNDRRRAAHGQAND